MIGRPINFVIYMEPAGKGRARMVRRGGKVITYSPGATVHAENMIRERALKESVFFGAGTSVRLMAVFYRSRPKSLKKSVLLPVSRPDWDNYAKLLTDALEKFVYANDSQITTAIIMKRFGSPPRIEVELKEDS